MRNAHYKEQTSIIQLTLFFYRGKTSLERREYNVIPEFFLTQMGIQTANKCKIYLQRRSSQTSDSLRE